MIDLRALVEGEAYDRPQLAKLWGYKSSSAIARGIVTPANSKCIVLFITRIKQNSLRQYDDYFKDDHLHIDGEDNHASDVRIVNAKSNGDSIILFFREKHHTLFVYYGNIQLEHHELNTSSEPSRFIFATRKSMITSENALKAELATHGVSDINYPGAKEGRKILKRHYVYERSAKNRTNAIMIHGTRCKVCGFDFNEFYGKELARDYIEIHHIEPLSGRKEDVNPGTDLIPLCSNCHSMTHRKFGSVTSIEDLRNSIRGMKRDK